MTRSWRSLIAASGALALALVALAACGQGSSAPDSPQPSSSQPTNSAGVFTLGGVEPDDGRAPLLNFIGGAQESIDVVIYQFDDARIRQALIDAHNRGVAVRVLMSWQLYLKKDEYADPSSRNYNRNTPTFNELRSAGIDVAWSRHQFPYTHQKSVVSDAGTDHGRAFIADYNFAPTYFDDGPSPFEINEGGARGFAVTSSDQGVVNEMTRVFNADWPPFSNGEPYTDPHLVWSPTTPQFAGEPPGTSGVALPELIDQASTTLNVYMYLADPNDPQLNQLIAAAQRGVKVRFVANCGALTKSDLKRVQTAGIKVVYQPASPAMPTASCSFIRRRSSPTSGRRSRWAMWARSTSTSRRHLRACESSAHSHGTQTYWHQSTPRSNATTQTRGRSVQPTQLLDARTSCPRARPARHFAAGYSRRYIGLGTKNALRWWPPAMSACWSPMFATMTLPCFSICARYSAFSSAAGCF